MTAAPLTGLAVGDALGMPFETAKRDRPDLIAWDGHSYGSSEYHQLGPGQWTDDTQMSMALARSLIENMEYVPEEAAKAYLKWFQFGGPRGMGRNTRKAMEALAVGVPWNQAGVPTAEGNGTAMRAAPFGAFYAERPEVAGDEASLDARITHATTEAREGSRAVAVAVAYLCSGLPRLMLLPRVLTMVQPSQIRNALVDLKEPAGEVGPHVVGTVAAAFYAFLSTDSYQSAVAKAIRFGGDTDSVASITGAFAGSFYGYEAIPKHFIEQLEKADEIHDLELNCIEP